MHSVKEMVIVYLILIISLIDFAMVFDAILTSRQGDFGAVTKLQRITIPFFSYFVALRDFSFSGY